MSAVAPHTLVRDLNLRVRARNALDAEGITYVAKLVSYSAIELMRVPNFGRVSLAEVAAELDCHGFKLRGEPQAESAVDSAWLILRKDVEYLRRDVEGVRAELRHLSENIKRLTNEMQARSPRELNAWRQLEYRVQQLEAS